MHQVTKLAIIPCTVSLETILFRKTFRSDPNFALSYVKKKFCLVNSRWKKPLTTKYMMIVGILVNTSMVLEYLNSSIPVGLAILMSYSHKTITCSTIINWIDYNNIFTSCSRRIQMALAVLLFGVGVATVTDLQLNRLGSLLSLFAVLTTCISQIVSSKQSIRSILFSLH